MQRCDWRPMHDSELKRVTKLHLYTRPAPNFDGRGSVWYSAVTRGKSRRNTLHVGIFSSHMHTNIYKHINEHIEHIHACRVQQTPEIQRLGRWSRSRNGGKERDGGRPSLAVTGGAPLWKPDAE